MKTSSSSERIPRPMAMSGHELQDVRHVFAHSIIQHAHIQPAAKQSMGWGDWIAYAQCLVGV